MKLTATRIKHLTTPGLHGDGGNLWLRVTETGNQSWVFRYSRHGKARVMGLGSLDTVPLGEARQLAVEARKLLFDIDPLDRRSRPRRRTRSPRTHHHLRARSRAIHRGAVESSGRQPTIRRGRIRCVTTPCR